MYLPFQHTAKARSTSVSITGRINGSEQITMVVLPGPVPGFQTVAVNHDAYGDRPLAVNTSIAVVSGSRQGNKITETAPVEPIAFDCSRITGHDVVVVFGYMGGTHAERGNHGHRENIENTAATLRDSHCSGKSGIEIEERYGGIIGKLCSLSSCPNHDGVTVGKPFRRSGKIDDKRLGTA